MKRANPQRAHAAAAWVALMTLMPFGLLSVASASEPTAADLRWLGRIGWSADATSLAAVARLGRRGYLEQQLSPGDDRTLPAPLLAALATAPGVQRPLADVLAEVQAENQRINQLATDEQKQAARQLRNQAAQQARYEAVRAHLLRAVYSPWQLKERLNWFWLNHFSVFADKANLRWTIADYDSRAIREHALGRFADLLWSTVTHPAMLEYLDNAQSAAGKVNENYARELLELHTLGVDGGYAQADVQELARVLTGLGVNAACKPPRLTQPAQQLRYLCEQGFEFNPARHDGGTKTLLGAPVIGAGLDEVRGVVERLARHPATARFVSRKLAAYFVADEPPRALVDRMARTFIDSDGDIASVLRTMFDSREFAATLDTRAAPRLKDPMQFVVSSLRLAYNTGESNGSAVFNNLRPVQAWLQQLSQPLFGRVTPDGYPLATAHWANAGQMARRLEIARAIGSSNAGLFNGDDNQPGSATGFPRPGGRLFDHAWQSLLGEDTRAALARASSQGEWNMLLIAAPEWMAQ